MYYTEFNIVREQYDMTDLIGKYPQLVALKNRELFLSGKLIESYGIIWNDELDIETETIYEKGVTVRIEDPAPSIAVGRAVQEARA